MKLPGPLPRFLTLFLLTVLLACGQQTRQGDPARKNNGARPQVQKQDKGDDQHPRIWVRASEREAILKKITSYPAVGDYYRDFQERVEPDLVAYNNDPAAYLSRLPFDRSKAQAGAVPPFKLQTDFGGADRLEQDELMHVSQVAIDCGVLYFLTGKERYARFAADILHTYVQAIVQMPVNSGVFNSGWVYKQDHLREAREIGAQLPILYDFVQPWLAASNTVYDLGKNERVTFDPTAAEQVFRTYCELALTQGGTGHNWPILEASSLVGNALALSDPAERAHYLKYFLEEDTDRQDALPTIGAFYEKFGGSWPESFGYSQHVGSILTYLFAILSHHDPALRLAEEYPQIAQALPEAYYFTYPGGKETILHGDGHRPYHPNIKGYETAYHLARRENDPERSESIGQLINHAVETDGYRRFFLPERTYQASMYVEPTRLLWFEPEVKAPAGDYPLPVTAELPFAGLTLQRNLSPSGRAEDGLMGFVGGGSYVHGHATGMSMELFGKGFVLGSKGGRTQYRSDIHENYYRLFAANNTVIVNGATTSGGGWARLGHDRVRRLAVEPAIGADPVSANYSFAVSSFRDTVGTAAEAYQERTLGIVRTSDTTGYYVDIFRSHSDLPEQYHDYIYRNVGETLRLTTAEGEPALRPTPDRFQASANGPWKRNRVFRQPGWHFFTDVQTSAPLDRDVQIAFSATRLGPQPVRMQVHMPGAADRTYTTATSPPLTEGPRSYRQTGAPTLVVRQRGSAWDQPFAAVYEPVVGDGNSVTSVRALGRGRRCQGVEVKSNKRAGGVTQLILAPADSTEVVSLEDYDIKFQGRYAVLTYSEGGELRSVYVGRGKALTVGGYSFRPADLTPLAFSADLSGTTPGFNANHSLYFRRGTEETLIVAGQRR